MESQDAIFLNARDMADSAERAAYLTQACGNDADLRQRVEAMLRDAAGADEFFGPEGTAVIGASVTEGPGTVIGRFKLLQKIGEGGMGVVYMAEQREPVIRKVALKIIKLGMDTQQVIVRFEAERQALALMDHPNIAKVLDGGVTGSGRPYFVMDLVPGLPITQFCDEANLSTHDRLELFLEVCSAIQHAHQKGIIHRDIKPSNILVTLHGDKPVPKVIDFGVAKATQGRLTDKTLFTQFQQFIGTPAYMSPEQASLSGLDIDTRSDIYALGVLLYELLTGRTPFDGKELLEAGLDEMRRTIREKQPPRPSNRISTLQGEDLTTTARQRRTDPPKLVHLVRGDLDWIVMKALEKDRGRRYDTANGLAADIKRHINCEPVVARPPSRLYELRKTVRRHRFGFAAAAALIIVLAVGALVSTLEAFRAKTEAAKATAISDFLQELLRSANPDALKGSEYTVRQLLDDFSAGLANQLRGQPEVEAAVRATMGRAYYRLGAADKAQPQLERALTLRRRIFGNQSEQVAESLVDNAWVCFEQGQHEKGEHHVREALNIYRQRGTAGQPVISALWALQRILSSREQFTEVEAVTQEALTIAGKSPGVEFPELASMIHGLADVKNAQAKYDEGATLALKAVAMNRRLRGPEHPETGWSLLVLGHSLGGQHKLTEAEAALREALRIFRKYYSLGHKSVDQVMTGLILVLEARRDSAGAEALYRELLSGQRAALSNDSPAVTETLSGLAHNLVSQGKQSEAEVVCREELALEKRFSGSRNPHVAYSLHLLTDILYDQNKWAEAEAPCQEAIALFKQLAQDDPKRSDYAIHLGHCQWRLADVLARTGRRDQREQILRDALHVFEQAARDFPAELYLRQEQAFSRRLLGDVLNEGGRVEEAEREDRAAIALYAGLKTAAPTSTFYCEEQAYTTWMLAEMLEGAGRLDAAEAEYRRAIALHEKASAEFPKEAVLTERLGALKVRFVQLLGRRGRLAEAKSMYREAGERGSASDLNALAWSLATSADPNSRDGTNAVVFGEKAVAATNRKNVSYLDTLAAAYAETGQFVKAISVLKEAIALSQNDDEKKGLAARLKLYESNLPYRDSGAVAALAMARLREGKFAEAEALARECLTIREREIPDDWRTFNARSMLGGSLLGQKKYAEAEPLLLSGYEGMKQRQIKIPPEGKPRLTETLQRLVQLYETTARPEQASEWKQKLAEFDKAAK